MYNIYLSLIDYHINNLIHNRVINKFYLIDHSISLYPSLFKKIKNIEHIDFTHNPIGLSMILMTIVVYSKLIDLKTK